MQHLALWRSALGLLLFLSTPKVNRPLGVNERGPPCPYRFESHSGCILNLTPSDPDPLWSRPGKSSYWKRVCESIVVKISLGFIQFGAPLKPSFHQTTAALYPTCCHLNRRAFTSDTYHAQSNFFFFVFFLLNKNKCNFPWHSPGFKLETLLTRLMLYFSSACL